MGGVTAAAIILQGEPAQAVQVEVSAVPFVGLYPADSS